MWGYPSRIILIASVNLLISYTNIRYYRWYKGVLIKPVHIPTTSQFRNQKQHPIGKALKTDVDAEITRMSTEEIVEPCEELKGTNNQVFAVSKKNDKICVVVDFNRGLN